MKRKDLERILVRYACKFTEYSTALKSLDRDSSLALNLACRWIGSFVSLCYSNPNNDEALNIMISDMDAVCNLCDDIILGNVKAPSLQMGLLILERKKLHDID